MNNRPNILFVSLNGHQRRYFRWLGERLANEYNVFYVHYTALGLKNLLIQPRLPEGISFTQEEIDEIIAFLLIKGKYRNFGPVRQFLHSRLVLESKAYTAIEFFYNYIRNNNIDLACVWNGTLVPLACATRVARKLGCKTLFFENGYLPNTTTVDPSGVNNCNSLVGKPTAFYQGVDIDPVKLEAIYTRKPQVRNLKEKWFDRFFRKKRQVIPEQVDLPERFIFVPFQVHDDTQVLLHSANLKTMEQFLETVTSAVSTYNSTNGDNIWVVAKEHPSDFGRVDYSSLRTKIQQQKVMLLKYYPTVDLIQQSIGAITLNSTVGIEALLYHKPVITMGRAFYNVPNLVHHASSGYDLIEKISILSQGVDDVLIDKFLYFLRYCYLAEGHWRQPDKNHFVSVQRKIHDVLNCKVLEEKM